MNIGLSYKKNILFSFGFSKSNYQVSCILTQRSNLPPHKSLALNKWENYFSASGTPDQIKLMYGHEQHFHVIFHTCLEFNMLMELPVVRTSTAT